MTYDLVVIGGGPGGYVAAIKAAQLGLRTACVEKRGALGGTCLNVGCIPSKALLHSSHLYHQAAHELANHGIETSGVALDLRKMMAQKDKTVADLTKGIDYLFKKNGVERLDGHGRLAGPGKVVVEGESGERELEARSVLIATGSESSPLKGVEVDEKRIVTSTGALELDAVPEHMLVIGGGVIGLEMASVWGRLGSKITVVEYLDRIVPGIDDEIAKQFQKILKKQDMEFKLGTKVTGVDAGGTALSVGIENVASGARDTLSCDVVLLAIGRRPYTEGLGLDTVGLSTDDQGRIEVDDHFRTRAKGVYAIGDVIRGPMLAHKAEEEGSCVAEQLAGQKPHIDYDIIPGVIYTHPEVATIGCSEEEARARGYEVAIGKFPFSANSRARATGMTEGLVKIVADKKTDRVLGCHIIGAEAGTMIGEIAIAMEFGASSEDIARTCHAHPTMEESIKEAALATHAKPIHI